jgi:hypothetical protein
MGIMSSCLLDTRTDDFNKLVIMLNLAKHKSYNRTFTVTIHPKYKRVYNDVSAHFLARGWIIKHVVNRIFSVTTPHNVEVFYSEKTDRLYVVTPLPPCVKITYVPGR